MTNDLTEFLESLSDASRRELVRGYIEFKETGLQPAQSHGREVVRQLMASVGLNYPNAYDVLREYVLLTAAKEWAGLWLKMPETGMCHRWQENEE